MTANQAMQRAMEWADGTQSHTNLGPNLPFTPDVIAIMDAQEVIKWTAIAVALAKLEEMKKI